MHFLPYALRARNRHTDGRTDGWVAALLNALHTFSKAGHNDNNDNVL